ncbi:MAG: hypothetical protein JW994_05250 [Candidatus Omnitrophica bacterium]|nr:hypothetical protein [Candidatus Omnitrophota bacterium]
MSIIADALKKAQESSKKPVAQMIMKSVGKAEEAHPGEKPRPVRLRLIALFFVAMLAFCSAALVFYNLRLEKLDSGKASSTQDHAAIGAADISRAETIAEKDASSGPAALVSPEKDTPVNEVAELPKPRLADINELVKLNGIMYTTKRPLAVINGAVWGEGEAIGDYRIKEIKNDFVKLVSGDREFILRLTR